MAEKDALELIKKFCHPCLMKADALKRVKFSIRDELDIDHASLVDVIHLREANNNSYVLQVVDLAASYQAARFLTDMSAAIAWKHLKHFWTNTYLGPPDAVIVDPGPNLVAAEFITEAKLAGLTPQ